MNKAELVEALELRLGTTRKDATDAVEAVIDIIARSVAKGDRVAISGFGTFERVARAARTGRNPRTGTPVKIKKTTVPKFKPGTAFKTYVAAPRSMPSVANSGGVAVTSRGLAASAPATKKAPAAKKATSVKATKSTPVKSAPTSAATKSAAPKTATGTSAVSATAKKSGSAPAKLAASKAAPAKKGTTSRVAATTSGAAKKTGKKTAK